MTWGRLARILGREGADPKVSRNFYIAVIQQVLLFGAETWVLNKRMEAALDAFQGRVARRLTGRMPRRGRDGKWLYLPLAGATKEAGIVQARTSVLRRQNTVTQFVATRPILGLCVPQPPPSLFLPVPVPASSRSLAVPTIVGGPMSPPYAPSPHRVPESVASQRIARPYSVSGGPMSSLALSPLPW